MLIDIFPLVRHWLRDNRSRTAGLFFGVPRYVSVSIYTYEISTLCIPVGAEFYSSRKLSSVSNAPFVFITLGVLDSYTFGYTLSLLTYFLFLSV